MSSAAPEPDKRLIVVCQRVCDLRNPDPKLGFVRGEYCSEPDCDAEVWIEPKMAHLLSREARASLMGVGTRLVCVECAKKYRRQTAAVFRITEERHAIARRKNELN